MGYNQSGFSIIEVLVSFALLALVAVGFMQFTDNHTKVVKSIDAGFEVVDFVGQARLILSHPRACKQTLSGLPVSSPTNISVATLRGSSAIPFSSPTAWNDYVYKSVGQTISADSKITLASMEVKYPATFNGEAELVMRFNRDSQVSLGGHYFLRSIPLTIVADPAAPTQIGTCFASGAKVANWSSMCATLGGTYDAATKKCRGLFKVNFSSQVTPGTDHWEKLEYSSGEVRIVIVP